MSVKIRRSRSIRNSNRFCNPAELKSNCSASGIDGNSPSGPAIPTAAKYGNNPPRNSGISTTIISRVTSGFVKYRALKLPAAYHLTKKSTKNTELITCNVSSITT
mmetsp:Transcript_19320/g.39002  ORF Transcript_19320/g.39002 Transcript_19320/m.39002 type:complete len:105 (+) Transcript_19320:124-438(+)